MRILEHGGQVHMVLTEVETLSVDTPGELERVEKLMESDKLLSTYRTPGP